VNSLAFIRNSGGRKVPEPENVAGRKAAAIRIRSQAGVQK